MIRKKAVSLLLTFALLLSLLPVDVYADAAVTFDESTGILSIKKDCMASDVPNIDVNDVLKIKIGPQVREIFGSFFSNYPNLQAFEVDSTNQYYFSFDGVLFYRAYDENDVLYSLSLYSYPRGKTDAFTIPDDVNYITNTAFTGVTQANIYVSEAVSEKIQSAMRISNISAAIPAAYVHEEASTSVSGLTLDKDSADLDIGDTLTLTATTDVLGVTWSVPDSSVLTMTTNGKSVTLTAQATGTAVVTATTVGLDENNQHLTATCTVTVKQRAAGVTVTPKELTVEVNRSKSLSADVQPDDAAHKTVTWSSSNEAIATVDQDGVVTGVAEGEATVTAAANDGSGKRDSCTVTVIPVQVSGLTLSNDYLSVKITEEKQLSVTVTPDDAANKTVRWSSSDETVATVDDTGKVTGVAMGAATITASATDGSGVSATCAVTVPEAPVNALTMSRNTLTLRLDQQHEAEENYILSVSFDPSYATHKNLTWTSKNPRSNRSSQVRRTLRSEWARPPR